ncbi:hypothetical protein AXZ77_1679 [Thioclava sp. ES.031]|uniref:hypothetical protein n=1 Tax=unclassified Thioclava TaxID=2621713 RepID=UPI000996D8C6|nr:MULTISPECIES: hypothetical protein [unclassified Thioclava]OOY05991.1 hypothetical protein BMI87_00280 [Thioclava sp. F28-4]PFG63088.1 hypothetical protein AXZ77_1679 [Thioclava sp. ES.031]
MLLERTLSLLQLDIGPISPLRARELGTLGYMEWLGGLPGDMPYAKAAIIAHTQAYPFGAASPAVAVFCELLLDSLRPQPFALPIEMPPPLRRGGARARRGL